MSLSLVCMSGKLELLIPFPIAKQPDRWLTARLPIMLIVAWPVFTSIPPPPPPHPPPPPQTGLCAA